MFPIELDTIVETVLVLIVGGLYGYLIRLIKDKNNEVQVYKEATKANTRDSYFRMCRYIISEDKEKITEADYENFECLYKAYHELGMNGTGDKLYEQIKSGTSITFMEVD